MGFRKGDTLTKEINGTVKAVDLVTNDVYVMWERVIRRETLNGESILDTTSADTNGEAPTSEELLEERAKTQAALSEVSKMGQVVNELRKELETAKGGIHEVHLKKEGKTVKVTTGVFHDCFKDVCDLINDREEVFLWGPTGCGKSHLAKQAAEACGLRFAFISCTAGMSEGQITGRLLPTGKNGTFEYVRSEFVDCYENGGVFLLDEVDAADPNVMLVINAALANGHLALPNRPAKPVAIRHADFVCVGAANTVGTGADRMYSGRNKLDAAFMERFACKIYMGYDERVDALQCPDDSLRSRLLRYRKNIMEHRLERALSTRWMGKAYRRLKAGWSVERIDTMYFQGWTDREVKLAKGSVNGTIYEVA